MKWPFDPQDLIRAQSYFVLWMVGYALGSLFLAWALFSAAIVEDLSR